MGWIDGKNVIIGPDASGQIVETHGGEVVDSDSESMLIRLEQIEQETEDGLKDPTKDHDYFEEQLRLVREFKEKLKK